MRTQGRLYIGRRDTTEATRAPVTAANGEDPRLLSSDKKNMARSPWRWRQRIALWNLALLVASVTVALGIAEWVVRWTRPQQLVLLRPDFWRPDSLLGHRHRESANTRVNLGTGSVRFVTDASGYRIAPGPLPTAPSERVLMLGDSFVEALSVEYEDTIPARIQALLEARLGFSIQVDNAGVGGWDPNQYSIEARLALSRRRYVLGVVCLFVANDVVTERIDSYPPRPYATRHRLRWPRNVGRREWIGALLYPANDALETRSHLYVLGKETLRVQLAKLGLTAMEPIPPLFLRAHAADACWQVTSDICADIAAEFSRHGTPVYFVLFPANYQVHARVFAEYIASFGTDPEAVDLEQPNRRLQEEFTARGLRLLDPLPAMRRQAELGIRMYPRADMHFNAEGHRVVSECVAPVLASALQP